MIGYEDDNPTVMKKIARCWLMFYLLPFHFGILFAVGLVQNNSQTWKEIY